MKYLKPYQLFEAKQVGILYHFTSLMNCYEILSSGMLESTREVNDDDAKVLGLNNNKYYHSFSFTRDKNLIKRIGQEQIDNPLTTRIQVDGNKMSHKYRFITFNWQHEWAKKNTHNKTNSFEAEEMVALEDTSIRDFSKYITGLELPSFQDFLYEYEYYASGEPYNQSKLEVYLEIFDIVEDVDEIDDLSSLDQHLIKNLYDQLMEFMNNY